MTTVAEVIGVSRSNLMERMRARPKKRIGRRPLPDGKLVAEIKAVIAELPTYGCLPVTIEWLSDNGSCYLAGETRSFARDIGLEPRTTARQWVWRLPSGCRKNPSRI